MCSFPANFQGPQHLAHQLHLDENNPFCSSNDPQDSFAVHDTPKPDSKRLAADYPPVDIQTVVQNCSHLSLDQQNKLASVLSDIPGMFDGKLRHYPDEEIHLGIDPTIHPNGCRVYPVPQSQLNCFNDKLNCLVGIGVLSPTYCSTWISGSFVIPKKDNTVRWISDFRALNKALHCKVYPIPCIQDILS